MIPILFTIIDKFRLRHSTLANIVKDTKSIDVSVSLKNKNIVEDGMYVTLTSIEGYCFGFAVEYSEAKSEYIIYTNDVYMYHPKYDVTAKVAKADYSFNIDRDGVTEFIMSAIGTIRKTFDSVILHSASV